MENCRHVLQQAMILAEEYRDFGYQEENHEDEKGDYKLAYGRFCTKSHKKEMSSSLIIGYGFALNQLRTSTE